MSSKAFVSQQHKKRALCLTLSVRRTEKETKRIVHAGPMAGRVESAERTDRAPARNADVIPGRWSRPGSAGENPARGLVCSSRHAPIELRALPSLSIHRPHANRRLPSFRTSSSSLVRIGTPEPGPAHAHVCIGSTNLSPAIGLLEERDGNLEGTVAVSLVLSSIGSLAARTGSRRPCNVRCLAS